MATNLTPEEKGVAESFIAKRKIYLEQGIKPGARAARRPKI